MATATAAGDQRAGRRPLFLSLRGRLIASHGFVILLALALVLAISAAYLRRYELAAEKERIEQLSQTLTISTSTLVGANDNPNRQQRIDAIDASADVLGIRLVVINRNGRVVYDSDETGNLSGEILVGYVTPVRALLQEAGARAGTQRQWVTPAAGDPFAGNEVLLSAGGPLRQARALAIVAPPKRFPLLARFLPRLLIVAAISLAIASVAGYGLSRRIAAPVGRLTVAADAMATGDLEQQVDGEGPDEIGRLVASFNTMSRQVAATARSQRELLANVAHELRTPLTSVHGYAQALRDGVVEEGAERERALATIGRESERMASLIGQLLDLARLESGQTRLTLRPVAVEPLVERVVDRFRPEAARKGIALEVEGGAGLAIQGDESRLEQILSNLVDNAIRHTPAGGRVRVAAGLGSGGDGRGIPGVRLTVADTGEGISAQKLPQIFDRFERAEGESGERAGFGLGLAIVRELAGLHGGSVAVASTVGVGTTFAVDLPAASGTTSSTRAAEMSA